MGEGGGIAIFMILGFIVIGILAATQGNIEQDRREKNIHTFDSAIIAATNRHDTVAIRLLREQDSIRRNSK